MGRTDWRTIPIPGGALKSAETLGEFIDNAFSEIADMRRRLAASSGDSAKELGVQLDELAAKLQALLDTLNRP